jgi:hypothetical protein
VETEGPLAGSEMDCFNSCQTTHSRCMNSATDWFQRYLCNVGGGKCFLKCMRGTGGGGTRQ